MLFRRHLQLIKNMSPDVLHVVPVLDDSMLDRPIKLQDALKFLLQVSIGFDLTYGCISYESLLLILCDHDLLVDWSSNPNL